MCDNGTEFINLIPSIDEFLNLNNKVYPSEKDTLYFVKQSLLKHDVKLINNEKGFVVDNANYQTTLGKYIRRRLKVTNEVLSDKALDIFVNEVIGKLIDPNNCNFELLTGDDIVDFYNKSEYHSCMTGNSAYKTELYAKNKEVISLVVLDNIARALLWTCVDGKKVLDRIYPSGTKKVNNFVTWAKSKNILLRKALDFPVYDDINFVDDSARIVMLNNNCSIYPYLDTFRYGQFSSNRKKLLLTNKSRFGNLIFENIDGHFYSAYTCQKCNKKVSDRNVRFVGQKQFCRDCYDLFIRCYECGVVCIDTSDLIKIKNNRWICKPCAKAVYDTCHKCGKYNHRANFYTFQQHKYCDNCYYLIVDNQ